MRKHLPALLALAATLTLGCTSPRDASYEISAHVIDATGNPAPGQIVDIFAGRFATQDDAPTFEASNFYTTDASGLAGPLRFGTTLEGGEVVEASATVRDTEVTDWVTITYDELADGETSTIRRTIDLILR